MNRKRDLLFLHLCTKGSKNMELFLFSGVYMSYCRDLNYLLSFYKRQSKYYYGTPVCTSVTTKLLAIPGIYVLCEYSWTRNTTLSEPPCFHLSHTRVSSSSSVSTFVFVCFCPPHFIFMFNTVDVTLFSNLELNSPL